MRQTRLIHIGHSVRMNPFDAGESSTLQRDPTEIRVHLAHRRREEGIVDQRDVYRSNTIDHGQAVGFGVGYGGQTPGSYHIRSRHARHGTQAEAPWTASSSTVRSPSGTVMWMVFPLNWTSMSSAS